jgi:hypothetical protein
MPRSPLRRARIRRPATALAVTGLAVAAALAVLPAASGGDRGNRLAAYVVPNTRGPLPACRQDGGNCTDANLVTDYLYVANANPIVSGRGPARADVPNAFVAARIDEDILVNGVQTFHFFFTPPPASNFASTDGHWVESAACPGCTTLGKPAVLPLEDAVVFYVGWNHGDGEPDGTYVFRWTIHGTLNGAPVDLTASSPPIVMTR